MADRIRKAVHNLTAGELVDLRKAHAEIIGIQDNRGYAQAAGYHGLPNWWCWHHLVRTRNGARKLALFLPWHRAYLYDFEMRLRDRVDTVTLPWWDWTKSAGVPEPYDVAKADGADNPLKSVFIDLPQTSPPIRHWTQREPGPASELPTQDEIDFALDTSDFMELTRRVEALHDAVHGWVGGDMGVVATAAFDPVFWAHHCMIDRLWRVWQTRNSVTRIPPDLLDEVLEPFPFRVRDVLDVSDLHYEYAASASVAAVNIGGK